MKTFISTLVIALAVYGCGKPEPTPIYLDLPASVVAPSIDLPAGTPPLAAPTPSPTPVSVASPQPSCKPFESVWGTKTTPTNQLLGTYIGPATNGPVFKLDFTALKTGYNHFTLAYNATHVCFYDLDLEDGLYTILSFQGCNPGIVLPGKALNTQCDYCPAATDPNYRNLNYVYTYTLSCNSLNITDPMTDKKLNYQ